jgi:glycosyltransferase 2 family protein
MKRTHWKWLWVSLAFSTIVLIVVLFLTINESTLVYLSRMDPFFLFLALLLHLVALAVWAMKIKKMAASLGYHVGFMHCFNLVNANLLVAAITPSQAGGEPVRIHELYTANVKLGDATAIVITERILDAVVLALGGITAIYLLGIMDLSPAISFAIYLAWAGMIGFVLLFLYSGKKPELLKKLLKSGSGFFTRKWEAVRLEELNGRIDREVENFHRSLSLFIHQGRSGLLWGSFFTAIFWSLEFLIPSLILMGLGESPFWIQSFVAQIVIAVIMMVPLTPGGSGLAEVSAYSLYVLFVNTSIVGVFVVLWRVIFFYFNIFLGVFSSIPIIRREIAVK